MPGRSVVTMQTMIKCASTLTAFGRFLYNKASWIQDENMSLLLCKCLIAPSFWQSTNKLDTPLSFQKKTQEMTMIMVHAFYLSTSTNRAQNYSQWYLRGPEEHLIKRSPQPNYISAFFSELWSQLRNQLRSPLEANFFFYVGAKVNTDVWAWTRLCNPSSPNIARKSALSFSERWATVTGWFLENGHGAT